MRPANASASAPLGLAWRAGVACTLLLLYVMAAILGAITLPGHQNVTGIRDLGHYYVPSLVSLVGMTTAEYVLWLGTLPLELFFGVIIVAIVVTGRGIRLGACLYAMYLLHWLCLHATTLVAPDDIVWKFPDGILTFGRPNASDFWFSGHVANAFVIALATSDSRPVIRAFAWSLFVFEILLVLSARTHYSIDVIGGIFVGYAVHRLSLDVAAHFAAPMPATSS